MSESGAYEADARPFAPGDQASYVSVITYLRVWWVRDRDGRWHASEYREEPRHATDADVRDLLFEGKRQGRDDVEWKPATCTTEGCEDYGDVIETGGSCPECGLLAVFTLPTPSDEQAS